MTLIEIEIGFFFCSLNSCDSMTKVNIENAIKIQRKL